MFVYNDTINAHYIQPYSDRARLLTKKDRYNNKNVWMIQIACNVDIIMKLNHKKISNNLTTKP